VNALGNDKVAEFINENCVATYLKVGTFQIINGNKVGGNVATYFCLHDGAVIHAVPGKTDADTLLSEARWAVETRKSALTRASNLVTGAVDMPKYRFLIREAHAERFYNTPAIVKVGRPHVAPGNILNPGPVKALPTALPRHLPQQSQAHWLLAANPLPKLDQIYPFVWEKILQEKLSGLPVAKK
jgi:hypothetical protein